MSKDFKIAICFGLIMGAILSICTLCFANEIEDVDFTRVSNLGMNVNYNYFYTSANSICYVELEKGYIYHFYNNHDTFDTYVAFSNSVPAVNVPYYEFKIIQPGESFNFVSSSYNYLYFESMDRFTVTREKIEGMSGFVDNIAYSLSVENLSSVWNLAVPIIAISVLLGLGFYLLKRLLNKIKRAKGGA